MKKNYVLLLTSVFLATTNYINAAGTISGNLDVRVTIGEGCSITHGGAAGSFNHFGTMDFGVHPDLSSDRDAKSSGSSGNDIGVVCSPNLAYTVEVDNGINASGAQRRMQNQTAGSAGNYIAYELYQDDTRATAWVAGTPESYTGTGAVQPIPFYGRIPTVTPAPAAGTYTDSVAVTITW